MRCEAAHSDSVPSLTPSKTTWSQPQRLRRGCAYTLCLLAVGAWFKSAVVGNAALDCETGCVLDSGNDGVLAAVRTYRAAWQVWKLVTADKRRYVVAYPSRIIWGATT